MKAKLLAALKTKYATLGLSDKAFDGVASVLVKTVTKEEEIEGVVNSDETSALLRAFQSSSDDLRRRNTELQAEFDRYKTEHPAEDPKKTTHTDDDANAKLLQRIEELERKEKERNDKTARDTKLADIRKKMKEAGSDNDNILDLVLEKAEFKDEDKVDDIATRLKTEYDAKYTKFYGNGPAPHFHRGGGGSVDAAKEDDDFADELRRSGRLPAKEQ